MSTKMEKLHLAHFHAESEAAAATETLKQAMAAKAAIALALKKVLAAETYVAVAPLSKLGCPPPHLKTRPRAPSAQAP
jgi:hypothetical protein